MDSTQTLTQPPAGSRPYTPRGACLKLWHDCSPEILISGPAGTGKSRACLEKLHFLADNYPGMRALIVRKTRESCTESCLVTFEEKVVPADHPILREGGQRKMRQSYLYPNGSVIVVGGLDKPSKTLSTEFDIVYVNEGIELLENDWEMLTRPLRNSVLPWQQIIADTNPDAPTHWLKRRCDAGKTKLLESRHEDNPSLWDEAKKEWTKEGNRYICQVLDQLTGPRKPRLRYGRWVQAEGVVYPDWDRSVHVIDRFVAPINWPRYWSIDFGYTNPFVWQLWAADPDGRLYLLKQVYLSGVLVEQHAKTILHAAWRDKMPMHPPPAGLNTLHLDRHAPRAVICDHDAEGRATLEKHLGIHTIPARKDVSLGIQAVAARLKKSGDGKPRLFFMRDSLECRDPELEDKKKPCCTEEEFDAYIWKPPPLSTNAAALKNTPDEPIDRDNHGMDAMRYMCAHLENWGNSVPDLEMIRDIERGRAENDKEYGPAKEPETEDEMVRSARIQGQHFHEEDDAPVENWKRRGMFGQGR